MTLIITHLHEAWTSVRPEKAPVEPVVQPCAAAEQPTPECSALKKKTIIIFSV